MTRVAAVTGSTGFIGYHLCSHLLARGWAVRGLVRPGSPKSLPAGVERVESSLEPSALVQACRGSQVVFHLAGVTRAATLEGYRWVNVEAAGNAGRAALATDAKLVLVSSQAAGGTGTADRPRTENDPDSPVSDYGRSKLAGEEGVRAIEGLRWSVVRPSSVYGPGDRDFEVLFKMAARGWFPFFGDAAKTSSLIFVEDLARALETVAMDEATDFELFFATHPEKVTMDDLRRRLQGIYGRTVRGIRVPKTALWLAMNLVRPVSLLGHPSILTRSRYRELSAGDWVCTAEKLRRTTGFAAQVGFELGFEVTRAGYEALPEARRP